MPSLTRELHFTSPKTSLLCRLPLEDDTAFELLNCHALNFVTDGAFEAEVEQLMNSFEAGDSPAVLCGDFNTWSERRLAVLRTHAEANGFAEASFGPEPWHQPSPGFKIISGLVGGEPDLSLDRVFLRGLTVIEASLGKGFESSDHSPLILRLSRP